MKYIRTIQEFTNDDVIRGIYEVEHGSGVKVVVRRNDKLWLVMHISDEPKLWEVRNDVTKDFLKQISGVEK